MMVAGGQIGQSLAGRSVERMKTTDAAGSQICLLRLYGHIAKYRLSVRGLEDNSMFVGCQMITILILDRLERTGAARNGGRERHYHYCH